VRTLPSPGAVSVAGLWASSVMLALGSAHAALAASLPTVSYRVSATVGTWQPLDVGDVAKTIGETALEVLTQPGLAQIERVSGAAALTPEGDYLLEVKGRLLDEAETHTIYLSFGPNKADDLPSFRATDTVVLSKLDRRAMLQKITESSRKAAAELLAMVRPALERAKAGKTTVELPPDNRPLPWRWPEVSLPKLPGGKYDLFASSAEARELALRHHVARLRADDAVSRRVVERCALEQKDTDLRRRCLEALAFASRTHGTTQRVVIEVFRKDTDSRVLGEADEQMQYFSGPARADAEQAWLEAAARGRVSSALEQLGEVPNLDVVIRSCLLASAKKQHYERSKRPCLELLPPLSYARRRAILWRFLEETDANSPYYLEGAGESEGRTGTEWQWAVEALLEESHTWDPALEEILWRRYQRSLSSFALDALSGWGAPSKRLVDRLLEAVQTGGDHGTVWGLKRMAQQDPALAPQILDGLSMMLQTGNYPKAIHKRVIEDAVRELSKPAKEPR
jgi:hypothetical protein